MFANDATPGHMYRTRHVNTYASSDGVCPGLEERTEHAECNDWVCSKRSETEDMRCEGRQNLVFIVDGSASIDAEDFELELDFMETLVSRTDMEDDGDGEVRVGMLLMGGTGLPQMVSLMGSAAYLSGVRQAVV